jgi:hypothetical protein
MRHPTQIQIDKQSNAQITQSDKIEIVFFHTANLAPTSVC